MPSDRFEIARVLREAGGLLGLERGTRFRARAFEGGAPVRELDNLKFAVAMARRGGVRRGEVLNARGAAEFIDAVRPLAR